MRTRMPLCLALALCSAAMYAKDSPKPADFSGNWTLDTIETKNLPEGLQSYDLVVNQDAQQVKVQAKLQGDLRQATFPRGSSPSGGGGGVGVGVGGIGGVGIGMPGGGVGMPGGGYPGGVGYPGGPGYPGGVGYPGGGMPGGAGGSPRQGKHSRARIAAFELYPPAAVYKLDGTSSTAQFGGSAHSDDATLKADQGKKGEALRLSMMGNDENARRIELKDQWKLSKDGRLLMVDRNVHSPEGSGTVHLVFRKQQTEESAGSKPSD